MKPTDFAEHLTLFLGEYLTQQKNVSHNTIKSYRDTFKLLLKFMESEEGIAIEKITIEMLSPDCITRFLGWLESHRYCSASTRNLRLAALKSFFRYAQAESPEHLKNFQKIICIPPKKSPRQTVAHLSPDEVAKLLRQLDASSAQGRRDKTLLSIMYDSGARVQEMIDLRVKDFTLTPEPVLTIRGKGSKIRRVPLMKNSARLLNRYIIENDLNVPHKADYPLFVNRQHNPLTKEGIAYILRKYAAQVLSTEGSFPKKIHCHMLRHSKAMHLLRAGVNLIYIRDFLGHSDVRTTEIYARSDTELKRKALQDAYPDLVEHDLPDWTKNGNLMEWLEKI